MLMLNGMLKGYYSDCDTNMHYSGELALPDCYGAAQVHTVQDPPKMLFRHC